MSLSKTEGLSTSLLRKSLLLDPPKASEAPLPKKKSLDDLRKEAVQALEAYAQEFDRVSGSTVSQRQYAARHR